MSSNRKRWNKVNTGPNTGSFVNEANENNVTRKRRQNKYKNLLEGVEERRAFVPSFNKKINDTGPNHPKEALLILGHGNEGWKPRVPIEESDDEETKDRKWKDIIPDLIKVPKGSIVVIKAHPGDVTLTRNTLPQYINVLNKDNEEVILDPIKNIDKITELFGSVSIFREGDMCPNISHYPLAIWGQDKPDDPMITLRQSGIASIPLKTPIEDSEISKLINGKIEIPKYSISKNNKGNNIKEDSLLTPEVKTKIFNNFKFMDPTYFSRDGKTSLIKILENAINENIDNKTTITDFFNNEFIIKAEQSTLFERKPNCVTYALNCRFINNHAHFVPEEVRLGYKSHNNLKGVVNYHVSRYVSQQRNETNTSTELVQNRTSTPFPIKNNNLNKSLTRKRVSSMAPEIKQEIKEAINQRRPTTLSRARATRQNTRNQNLNDYNTVFKLRLNDPTYKQSLVNKLENLHPGIEEQYFNKILNDNEKYEKLNNWAKEYYKYSIKYTNISKNPKILEYQLKKKEEEKKKKKEEKEMLDKLKYESNKENVIWGIEPNLRYLLNADPDAPALKRDMFETIKGYFKEPDYPDFYYSNTLIFIQANPEFTDEIREIIKAKIADPNFKNDSKELQELKTYLGL